MSNFGIPTETVVGIAMLLVGVPYVLRDKLRQLWRPGLTIRQAAHHVTPYDVLQLVERTECPAARDHLVAALNCLLERPDAADD